MDNIAFGMRIRTPLGKKLKPEAQKVVNQFNREAKNVKAPNVTLTNIANTNYAQNVVIDDSLFLYGKRSGLSGLLDKEKEHMILAKETVPGSDKYNLRFDTNDLKAFVNKVTGNNVFPL